MDIVSFETAKKLKEAGFPTASDKHMKYWYAEKKFIGADGLTHTAIETVISAIGYMAAIYYIPISLVEDKFLQNDPAWNNLVFAPAATDIMRHLPYYVLLQYQNTRFRIDGRKHDNPAEVAAAEYLDLHEKEK